MAVVWSASIRSVDGENDRHVPSIGWIGAASAFSDVLGAFGARTGVLTSELSASTRSGSVRTTAVLLLANSVAAPVACAPSVRPRYAALPPGRSE